LPLHPSHPIHTKLTIVPATVGSEEKSISLLPHNCIEKESLTTPSLTNWSKTGRTLESGWWRYQEGDN